MLSAKSKTVLTLFLSTLGIFTILTLTSANFSLLKVQEVKVLGVESSPDSERTYWQKIVNQNPTYRDGFIELARVEAEMGNFEASNVYLGKAKEIDPNSLNLLKTEIELLSSK